MRSQKRRSSGFTLIEILLALVILMVGIVGVLGLFPVAIRNVNDSVEDTTASNLAQSLNASLTEAMRRPVAGVVTVTHDGLPAGRLSFPLPVTTLVPATYPAAGGGTDGSLEVYQLGTDLRVAAAVGDIRTRALGGDPSEPTQQYSYQFEVMRPVESEIVVDTAGTTTDLPLYQFRIMIYRNYESPGVPPGQVHPSLVKEFTTFIAGGGL